MREELLEKLAGVDERLGFARRRSLCPDRDTVTPLRVLGEHLLTDEVHDEVAQAFVSGLSTTAELMLMEFPENVFWDLDLLATTMLNDAQEALSPRGGRERINEMTGLLMEVHEIFGQSSVVRFRYTHDFLYGYDWARWIARDPSGRHGIGPYHVEFLRYVLQRGQALLQLIASGTDELYGTLPPDEYRNPFPFDRSPEAEIRLHEALSRDGYIPVPAWTQTGPPNLGHDHSGLRLQRARELGLLKGASLIAGSKRKNS